MKYFSSRVFIGAALFLGLGALGVNFALAQTTVLQLPPAGGSYVDPITGKTVYRLTDRQLCPAGAHHIYSDTYEHSSYGTIVRCGYDRTNTNVWRWVLIGPDHKTILFSDLTTSAKAPTSANNFDELQWLPNQKRILGRHADKIYELDPWNGVTKLYVQMPTIGTTACRFDWRVNPQGHVVAHTGNKLMMCIFDPATGIVSTKDVGSIASNPDQTSALWNGKGLFTWDKNPQRAWDPDFSNEIIFDDFQGHLGQFRDASGQWYTVNAKEDKLANGGVGQVGCPGISWRPEEGIYNAATGKRVLIWGCDQPAGTGQWDRNHWTTANAVNRFASSGHTSIALWDVDWTTGKVSRTELARTHTTLPDGSKPYWGTPRATANYDLTEVLFTSGMCDGQVLETDGSVKKCPANIVLDTDLYVVAVNSSVLPPPPPPTGTITPSVATYTAVTDRNFYPEPALPTLGPAGYKFTDPTFGSRMLRVTDANTEPGVTWNLPRSFGTPSGGETNTFNSNSTMFFVQGSGGEELLYNFDPATMTATRVPGVNSNDTAFGGRTIGSGTPALNNIQWSYTDPDLIYGVGSNFGFYKYKVSTAATTLLQTASTCGITGFSGGTGEIDFSKDDQRMLTPMNGIQDQWNILYIYDQAKGCRWLNTQTGQVGGQWGPTGTIASPDRFGMHNVRISKDGKYARISIGNITSVASGAGVEVWDLDTLNMVWMRNIGHMALGYGKLIGTGGGTNATGGSASLNIRDLTNLTSPTYLIQPPLQPPDWSYDSHASWNNAQPASLVPVCMSTYRSDSQPAQRAWENEIMCARTDGVTSTVWRFAHERSIYNNTFQFSPRGNVSQDGKFYMFTSNWGKTVGTGRRDAFIVELAGSTSVTPPPPTSTTVTNFGRPVSDITTGWKGTAPPYWSNLDEVTPNDSDFVRTGFSTGLETAEVKLSSVTVPTVKTGHVLRVRAQTDGTGNTLTYQLMQGTTVIASANHSLPQWSTWTTDALTLTTDQASQITDYNNLSVKLIGNAALHRIFVSWIELEVPTSTSVLPPPPPPPSDTTPPAVSLISPASGSVVSSIVNVSAAASDNVGVAGVQFKLDGTNLGTQDAIAPYAVSWDSTTAVDGIHNISAIATDAAGNSAAASINVTVSNVPPADTTAPSVPTGLSAVAVSSSQINLSWSASTDNVGVVGYKVFRGDMQIATTAGTSYQNTGLSPSTTYKYSVSAYDVAGNNSTRSALVSATTQAPPDTTAPTVSITNPLPSATVSGTVLITASASDNIGVTSVRFILDGTPLGLSVTAPPYQVFWNTLTSGNGSHTLRAIAQDAAGNTANSQTITVTVQNIPYVSLVSPTDDSTLSDTAILLANATNSIAHVQFVLDGLDYGPQIGAPPYQIFWNTLASSNGSHTLRAKAQDLGGNQSISSQITVTVANDGNFVIGDRVRVVRPAKVHSTPSLSSGTVLGMQKKGALGTVTEGPVTVDRYKWWKVDFDASVTDGWVQGRYLANQQ